MTALVAGFAIALALLLAWYGARRGALAMLLGWIPLVAAVLVLFVALRAAWTWPRHFTALALAGCVVAVAAYLAAVIIIRARRRRAHTHPAVRKPPARGVLCLDHAAGALLGILYAAFLCFALAITGSLLSFSVAVPPGQPARPGPAWQTSLRSACRNMADIANFGILDRLPGIGSSVEELRSLITILNAPSDQLQRAGRSLGLDSLVDIPEVRAAVLDDAYLALLDRVRAGDLTALPELAKNSNTVRLLECPGLRKLIKTLRPSTIARQLRDQPPAARPSDSSAPSDSSDRTFPPITPPPLDPAPATEAW